MLLKIILTFSALVLLQGCATKELTPMEKQAKRAELIEHCRKLKREMDELKGKPLRQNAATQSFNTECRLSNEGDYYQN
ncbi:MAG: hypothetical protein ACI9IA_000933 [Enterobacterales bacterium]|jgi:hypothetical protein